MRKLASLMVAFTSIAITAMDERSPSYRKKVNAVPSNPKKVIPAGSKEYHFEGFSCIATNQKNANRKYAKWKEVNP